MKRKPAGRIAGKSPIAGVRPPARARKVARPAPDAPDDRHAQGCVALSFRFAAPQMDHRRTAFPGPYRQSSDARSA